ncbi:hypothetical protein M1D34_31795 (plasmid) [Ensifer sp. D2-11]
MNFLDAYNLRARLLPAVIAIAPAIALALVSTSYTSFSMPETIAIAAVAALFVGFADVARRRGKWIEPRLFSKAEGKPSVRFLRHSDTTIDDTTKRRYREFLARKIGEQAPTLRDEQSYPSQANGFYERCGTWLREQTRDTAKFPILFEENKTYGFRRNLLGLKWPGLLLNASVVFFCVAVLHAWLPWAGHWNQAQIGTVLVVAAIHAGFFLFLVSERAVAQASDQYARQLLLSCENLMKDVAPDA